MIGGELQYGGYDHFVVGIRLDALLADSARKPQLRGPHRLGTREVRTMKDF